MNRAPGGRPGLARFEFKVSGPVFVEVLITARGDVASPRVVSGLPAPAMVYAALEAVKRWCYLPATVDGEPVAVPMTVTVNYELSRR